MQKPDDIVEEFLDEAFEFGGTKYGEHRWTITWKPIMQWEFDQYGSSCGKWNDKGSIVLWESTDHNYRLEVKAYKVDHRLYTFIDQWGTYYMSEGELYVASEEGTRSFWIAYQEALKMFTEAAEFKMKAPDSERYDQTVREKLRGNDHS